MRVSAMVHTWVSVCLVYLLCGDAGRLCAQTPSWVKAEQLKAIGPYETRTLPGLVKANNASKLSFRVSGQVDDLPSNVVGKRFEKGAVIACLDDKDYQLAVQQARAAVATANATAVQAGELLKRNEKLWADNDIAEMELIDSKSNYRVASNQVRAAMAQLREARDNLAYTRLKAPGAGYVSDRLVVNYEVVDAGQPVVEFIDTSSFDVPVNIPESLYLRHDHFDRYECQLPAVPGSPVSATLKSLGVKALPPTYSYPLTVTVVPSNEVPVYAGMKAAVTIYIKQDPQDANLFVVPGSALFNSTNQVASIWVVDEGPGVVHKQNVQIHGFTPEGVQISGMLKEGDWIVTAGAKQLHENQKVNLLK